jgi:four helix bundle protein
MSWTTPSARSKRSGPSSRRSEPTTEAADQLRDAASSMVLNIGEAAYSDPGHQRARLSTASGSANEARVALRLAGAWGYAATDDTIAADAQLDVVIAKLYRLLHRR